MGDFDQALVNLKRAFELDPLSAHFANALGNILRWLREYPEAEHYYELAIIMDPNRPIYYIQKAWSYLLWQGNLRKARAVMDKGLKNIDTTTYPRSFNWQMNTIDIWDGRYQDALDRLSQAPEVPETSMWRAHNALRKAEIYGYLNNKALERQHYEYARKFLENKVAEHPGVDKYRCLLGLAYAGLGDKDKAIEHGKRGTDMLPVTRDADGGPLRLEELARIYVMVGEYDDAIDTIEYLLSIPYTLSKPLLKIDPAWDPLRDHPGFIELLESGN